MITNLERIISKKGYFQFRLIFKFPWNVENSIWDLDTFIYLCFIRTRGYVRKLAHHCEFLEYWNTQKSVWRIWQHFSHLLNEGIPKIWLFEGRLRQGKNVLPDGLNWLCYFVGNSKSHRENSIYFLFLESSDHLNMKNVVKFSKHFFVYLFQYSRNSQWNKNKIIKQWIR